MKTFAAAVLMFAAGCASASAPSAAPGEFTPTAQESIVPPGTPLEILWSDGDFTEGPAKAPDGTILFSDIGNRIMKFDPKSSKTTVFREPSGKANGLKFDPQGRLLACEGAGGGNRRVSITERDGSVRTLADRWEGKRFNSPNDLALDARGNVYFTDPRYGGDELRDIDFEGVYVVSPTGAVTLATRDVQKPNGILVSADGQTVYVADTNSDPRGNHQLVAFRVQTDGTLTGKRVLYDFGPDRRPIDGMALDVKGRIYAAGGTGERAGLYVFGTAGEQLAFVRLPGDPTNCAFGASGMLYITGQGPEQPGKPRRFALFRLRLPT
ncbi:MAG TPA: SMP-30/gluconolactonase/LRE family protein [Planctomycetota bacterium]|nr:SMP-30/gluconolactonase/LRE family protein [Planctomycetota bacterium]